MILNEKAIRNIVKDIMNKIKGKRKPEFPKDGDWWVNSKGHKLPFWYKPDPMRHPYESQEDLDLYRQQYDSYGEPINR